MSFSHKKKKKTIEFFRIILGHNRKFVLPNIFVGNNKYGKNLSNAILLRGPTGPVWPVELRKSDDKIWFGNGWKGFVDYFSLKYGNLLVFRYEGDSCFNVYKIFGRDTLEIEYPINRSGKEAKYGEKPGMRKVEEIQSDVSGEIMDDIAQGRKRREKRPSPCLSPYKRMRTSPGNGMQSTLNVEKSEGKSSNSGPRKYGSKTSIPPAKEAGRGTSAAQRCRPSEAPTTKRKAIASPRAGNVKSTNPFFVVAIRPSYIAGHELHIPLCFSNKYFPERKCDIILQDLDGRRWSVCYKVYQKTSMARFCQGWKEFVRDNNLQAGDTCVFKLLEGLEICLGVTILRGAEDTNDHLSAGRVRPKRNLTTRSKLDNDYTSNDKVITCRSSRKKSHDVKRWKTQTEFGKFSYAKNDATALRAVSLLSREGTFRAFERASKRRFNHPNFKVVIQSSFLDKTKPTIPAIFVGEHIKQIPEDVTLQFKDQSWSVKLSTSSGRRARFASGWLAFAVGNNLMVGDICVFEMTQRENFVFRVSIFKG